MRFPDIRLLVFTKAPVPGTVKTRLLPVLDAGAAAALHAELVEDSLARYTAEPLCPVELHCAPDGDHPFFEQLASRYPIVRRTQRGADLGERMAHAVDATLAAGHWPLLVGTDCPTLDSDSLSAACRHLRAGHAVLGPAEDGGYVLLGLRQRAPALFRDMPWGTEQVLLRTRAVLAGRGWDWRELPQAWDLDRPADLLRYRALRR